ncbi:MAG: MarR family transcriptional regulator [Pseudarthrobacter sp.]
MERSMAVEGDSMPAAQNHAPTTGDLDVISQWGLVIEGFQNTNKKVHAEVSSAFSLEPAEAETLLRLVRTPGARMPMAKLAREVAFSNGGFTKIADRLAKRSLVQRSPCAEDRRVVYLELSAQGSETANALACFVAGLVHANFVEVLGKERAQLVAEAMAELRDAHSA